MIVWPGFLASTAVYAAAIWGGWFGTRSARWALRRRAGRCPWCGYPRTGLAPAAACPECGRAMAG